MDWTATGPPPPIVTGPMRTFVEARGPPDPSWELVMMGSVYAGAGRGSNGRGILGGNELPGAGHVRLHREALRPRQPGALDGPPPSLEEVRGAPERRHEGGPGPRLRHRDRRSGVRVPARGGGEGLRDRNRLLRRNDRDRAGEGLARGARHALRGGGRAPASLRGPVLRHRLDRLRHPERGRSRARAQGDGPRGAPRRIGRGARARAAWRASLPPPLSLLQRERPSPPRGLAPRGAAR